MLVGGIIISPNKSLLIEGVMIPLALIPAGTLFGMLLFQGIYKLTGTPFLQFLFVISIVVLFTELIFYGRGWLTTKGIGKPNC